jgi:hypothetical protein
MGRKRREQEEAEAASYLSAAEDIVAEEERARRHQHPQIHEELHHVRSQLGRISKRLAVAEAQLKGHAHEEHGEPPVRMGVHVDGNGQYFMRRPDGWHQMAVMPHPSPLGPRKGVQRLAEKND